MRWVTNEWSAWVDRRNIDGLRGRERESFERASDEDEVI